MTDEHTESHPRVPFRFPVGELKTNQSNRNYLLVVSKQL